MLSNAQRQSMIDPSILETSAYKLIQEDYFSEIKEGPDYICEICHKCEYRGNVSRLESFWYKVQIFGKCHTAKSQWVCKNCDKLMGEMNRLTCKIAFHI